MTQRRIAAYAAASSYPGAATNSRHSEPPCRSGGTVTGREELRKLGRCCTAPLFGCSEELGPLPVTPEALLDEETFSHRPGWSVDQGFGGPGVRWLRGAGGFRPAVKAGGHPRRHLG